MKPTDPTKAKLHLYEDWLREQYVVRGRSLKDIGEECGVSRQAVHAQATKCGLWQEKEAAHRPIYQSNEWLFGQIVTQRKFMADVAREIGVSSTTIAGWASRYGIRRPAFTQEERIERNRECNRRRYRQDAEFRKRMKETSRKWREENPERAREAHRRWRERNKGMVSEAKRRWRDRNREKLNADARRRYHENVDAKRAYNREYRRRKREEAKAGAG